MGDTTNNTKIILIQEEPRGPSQLVEVPVVQNGVSKVPFPDIQQLRSDTTQKVIIKGVRLVTQDTLIGPVVAASGANAPLAELQKLTLTLYSDGWEKGQNIPLLVLNDVATPAGTFPYRMVATKFSDWKNVDWTKSFLQYANGQVSAGAPYTVIFDVEYQRLNQFGTPITGAGN
jgi:hypothetical protein